MSRATLAAAAAALFFLLAPGAAGGAALEGVGTFDEPIYIASDPEDAGRLLVAERRGAIVEARGEERTVWADLQDLVLCCVGERGLLSIAPAPDFHTSDRLYVAYTGKVAAGGEAGDIHIDSFRHSAGALVREPILDVPHSDEPNHNGGQLQFGPDGRLYASFGDGGGGGDPFDNGQDLETLLGKMIRIDPRPGAGLPSYVVPGDNPFIGMPAFDEIWSYGLRNPWRFSFDRGSGDMVIGDRGQNAREEIDLAPRLAGTVGGTGANYGWDCREGLIEYSGDSSEACGKTIGFIDPVFDYPHEDQQDGSAHGCSITGGYVVRDESVPDLYGRYLYGDFCLGAVRSIDLTAADPRSTDRAEPDLSVASLSLNSFGEDSCGRVYIVTRGGAVYRVVGGQPSPCDSAATTPEVKSRRRIPAVTLRLRRGRVPFVRIHARVRPCAGNRGRRVILKRDGRRFARKRVIGRCVVRFRVPVRGRASFRALLPLGPGAGTVRSRKLVVRGLRGQ